MRIAIAAILFVCLFGSSIAVWGQCPSNKGQIEVGVSYGLITGDELSQQINLGDNNPGNKNITYNSGAPFVTVRYFLFNRLAIGLTGGVTNERWQYNEAYTANVVASTAKQKATTAGFEVYYIYVFRKYFEAYTLVGFGPSFTTTETITNATSAVAASDVIVSATALKMQYTPIGVRAGGRLGAFAELGIGYKGVFNFGVSYRFGPSCWWKEKG